ncbi:PREDICTED: uncharacterized protein LOC100638611 isoform X7 [Amphimedon queenslandica]|uniref:Protein-tyrosine-phosphatase n=1 Tax=Amphimedon queenslandica TaxID=400682 RepID=A0AAN0JJM9_AMPQE|nr:PREDICTED: uncharacterized protein LOC100638611 isoform X7 [Amphimedon queenslandica]|eukprot:XP_019857184.1 PREDICTED: uncharacterized protein LOC100638611 isoform X7 [Amphimedon queenslandica]
MGKSPAFCKMDQSYPYLLLFLLLSLESCFCVPISSFYSFGIGGSESAFTNNDDSSTSLSLSNSFIFYNQSYSTVFINNNGLLSFNEAVSAFTSQPFPLPQTLIAPFWADVDTRSGAGTVYYRETSTSAIVNKVARDVLLAFPGQPSFTATSVVIVTWYRVGYYSRQSDKLNTFQCVLATDGSRSYVIFLYLDNGINWVTGDASGGNDGFGGTEAYVGFNSGGQNSTYFAVQGSRTPAVVNIETTSNVDVAGLWIFQVNEANIVTSTVTVNCSELIVDSEELSVFYNSTTYNSTATYSCESGFNLVGATKRTCLNSGNWSGDPPSCEIVNCSELIVDSEELSVSYNSTTYNSTATYSCESGFNLVGATKRTCLNSGNWSGDPPSCEIVNCSELIVDSEELSVSYNSTTYNSTATYSCESGFNLVGATKRTCLNSGNWSGDPPSCEIVNCSELIVDSGELSVFYNSTSYNSTATYSCESGFNLAGVAERTCLNSGNWSGDPPSCEIVNCSELIVDSEELSVFYNSTSYNSTATYSCESGFNLAGVAERTCLSSGNWSGDPPFCKIVNCSELIVDSEELSVSYNSTSYNSTATYSCESGFNLAGVAERTCLSSGNWSGDPPFCKIVNCSELIVDSEELSVSYNSTSYNSTATYSCESGFNLAGVAERTCLSSGNWSGDPPSCEIVNCSELIVDSEELSVSYNSTSYNSTATYSCESGFNLAGVAERTCLSSGNWSGDPPSCEIVNCSELIVDSEELSVSYNSTSYNSTATYSCESGFNLAGVAERTCLSSGNWSRDPPYCQIVNCSELIVETNAFGGLSVSYSSNSRSYNSTATYSCDDGYSLTGTFIRTCLSSGNWSGDPPSCEIVHCSELIVDSEELTVSYNSTSYNSTATYSCESGFNLAGVAERTCLSSGNWSGDPPSCEIVNCSELIVDSEELSVFYNSTSYNSTATYSCESGFNLAGVAERTCLSSGNWSGDPPFCKIVNCNELIVDSEELSVSYNSTSYNSTATYSCESGFNLVGFAERTCLSSGNWSRDPPYCQIVNCSELIVESNAFGRLSVSYSSNSRSYNSTATYSCEDGYSLTGVSIRTCLSSGNWSGDPPSCEIVHCSELIVDSEELSVSYNSTSYNSTATYSCESGFNLAGVAERTCLSSGNWSEDPPYCQIVNCSELIVETNAFGGLSVSYSSNSRSYNSTATYSCEDGYSLTGIFIRTCLSSGNWSGDPPSCEIVHCSELIVDSEELSVSYNSTSYNSTATYSCESGFNLAGVAERTCLSSGNWSGDPPYCQIVNCSELMVESNAFGGLSVSFSSNSRSYNSTATYSCEDGYSLIGVSVRTCLSSGNWSGDPPFCKIVNCSKLIVDSEELSVFYNSTSYNSTATYSCVSGFNLAGVAERTCLSSGNWSGDPPSCEIVNCSELIVDSEELSVSYNSTSYNSTATYSCESGFNLVGVAEKTCLSSGNWSGDPPYCQIVNCSELIVESNAFGGLSVSYSSNSRSYNSTAIYSCEKGFSLTGVSIRTCLSSGNWSGDPPFCKIVNCSELMVESNAYGGLSVSLSSSNFNSTATYSCTYEGYVLVGNGVRTCQANGNWSEAEPNCEITAINLNGASNESSIIISWDLPCQLRNMTKDRMVNNYTVMVTDIATGEYFIIIATKIPVVLSNLSLNTNYSIRIAVFTNKLGPFSDYPLYISTHLTAPTHPAFDLNINSSSPTSFMISWTPPMLDYLNGPNITYVILVTSANSSFNYTSNTNYAIIAGLQPFTTYWCRVAVRNNAGMGPYSLSIEIKTLEDVPSSAPVNVIFIFINARTLLVQWGLIPLSNRNGIIMYYEILVIVGEKTYIYKTSERNITIENLQPSYTYNISVAAFTNGRGPFSEPISITMPDDVPSGRPQSLSLASAGATSLSISWNPPDEEDRNGNINEYIVNVTNTDTLVTTQFTTANNDFSIVDLNPDTTYSLSVAARNANGTGPFTQSLLTKTGQSAPSQPRHLKATAIGSSSILLAWESPSNPNGDITAYYINITDESTSTVVMQETSNITYVIITDLSPNNTYRCHVAAATTYIGQVSEYVFVNTEEDVPTAAPLSVLPIAIDSTMISISWSPPNINTTNGVIRYYKVSIINIATGSEQTLTTANSHLTILMLTPFTAYSVRVAAFTIGTGPYSRPINVTTAEDIPSDAPKNFDATTNGSNFLILKWFPPNTPNGIIKYYQITLLDQTNSTVFHFNTTEFEFTINNLLYFTKYTCYVSAFTVAAGPAAMLTIMTQESAPSSPPTSIMLKSVNYTSINVSWSPPAVPNGLIHMYIIRISNGLLVIDYNSTEEYMLITGLMPNQNYSVSLAAVTIDIGPFSTNLVITLQEKVATDPPTGLCNELNGSNLTLHWLPPPDGSVDGIISGYRINCTGENGHFISKTVSMTRVSVDLEKGTYYTCMVCILTSAGCGPAAVNYINTYSGFPVGPPQSLSVNTTDLSILIDWEAPSDPLNIITSYAITYQLLDTPVSLAVPRPVATVSGITDTMYLLELVLSASSYNITVYANTSNGTGIESEPIAITTEKSGTLLNFMCSAASSTDINCSWENLSNDDYQLHYSILPSFNYYTNNEGTINEGRIHDLKPYVGYVISLQLSNTNLVNTVVLTQPEIPTASVEDISFNVLSPDSFTLSWKLPPKNEWKGIIENFIIKAVPIKSIGENAEINITSLRPKDVEITVAPRANNPDPSLAMEPFAREEVIVSNLEPDFEYSLTISIDNAAGRGPSSSPLNISMPEAAPSGRPLNLVLSNVQQTSFTATWLPPNLIERNGRIISYMVQVTRFNLLQTRSFETQDTRIFLQGYYPYEHIMIKVAARTSVGLGPYSSVLAFNTNENVPSVPVSFSGTVIGSDQVILSWDMPQTTDGVISQYQVIYSGYTIASNIPAIGPIQINVPVNHLQLFRLRNGLVYHFSVRAENTAGYGPNATTIIVLDDNIGELVGATRDVSGVDGRMIAVSVLAGLFGLLLCLFLSIGLICCLCARMRQKKRENNKMHINGNTEIKEISFANIKDASQNEAGSRQTNMSSSDNQHVYDEPNIKLTTSTVAASNDYDTVTSPTVKRISPEDTREVNL